MWKQPVLGLRLDSSLNAAVDHWCQFLQARLQLCVALLSYQACPEAMLPSRARELER